MEKKAKISRTVFVTEWAGQNGPVYYHEIELDNGDKGQIGSKEKMPSKLNPGEELTYTIESTPRGNKIKAVSPAASGGGFKGRTFEDPKQKMIGLAMSYTKDLIIGSKAGMQDLEKEFNRIYNIMISKL